MRIVIAFLSGVILGFVVPHYSPKNSNSVDVTCPPLPEIPECRPDSQTLESLRVHQDFLMKCYNALNNEREATADCRDNLSKAQADTEEYRQKYINQSCP